MDTTANANSLNAATQAADQHAQIALREALSMLVPLAGWLVRNGVPYSSFAPALKGVFVEAARRELQATGSRITDSAVSVLSGVHRRDIRALEGQGLRDSTPKTPSLASQVFTRWITDAAWRDAAGQPKALPKSGDAGSFDALSRTVSTDVHPRTVLAEMSRLGLVNVDSETETVSLCGQAFIPEDGFEDMAALFSANVADHLAAAAHNLGSDGAKFLEQSIFAGGLTSASAQALGGVARQLWSTAFEHMVREASARCDADEGRPDAQHRMRFGVFYYHEPEAHSAGPPDG